MSKLVELYQDISEDKVLLQIYLRHWLTSVIDFDPMSFEPMTTTLTELCQKSIKVDNITKYQDFSNKEIHDFLYHISTNILGNSLNLLLSTLNTKIVREHEIMPLVNAREFDRTCMQWVSRKSGRNLKEKLALDNKILAVKRKQNYDTIENRLLKVLLKELQYLFDEKQNICKLSDFENSEQELSELIEAWLTSDEAHQIGGWQNFPPNNTLLQHKHYRKIWNVWQFLQKVDEFLDNDKENYEKNTFLILHLRLISELNQYQGVRIPQFPIQIDYDNFSVDSPINIELVKGYLVKGIKAEGYFLLNVQKSFYQIKLFNQDNQIQFEIRCKFNNSNNSLFLLEFSIKGGEWVSAPIHNIDGFITEILSGFKRFLEEKIIEKDRKIISNVTLDLSNTEIKLFDNKNYSYSLGNFIAQIWHKVDEKYTTDTIFVGDSNTFIVSDEVETFSLYHALKSDKEKQEKIIPILLQNLEKHIDCEKINLIISDRFNDFDLQVLRQSLNIYFKNADLLPKSIAAAFSLLSQNNQVNTGDSFVFIDIDNQSMVITLLKANHNKELDEIGCKNVVWERYPSDIIEFDSGFKNYLIQQYNLNKIIAENITNNFHMNEISLLNLSLISSDNFYHLEKLDIDTDKIKIEQKIFIQINEELERFIEIDNNVKFIVSSDIAYIIHKKYSNRLIKLNGLYRGVNFLSKQQKILGDSANLLWQDHLPYMGIRVKTDIGYGKFDLVKNITISPKRGKRIGVKVPDTFTLPKGQASYSFPLYLGDKNKSDRYQATLKSSIFPLKEDKDCEVKLYYTYGAEEPYELYFIIVDGKDKIKAEWGIFDDSQIDYPKPDYPKPLAISELTHFRTKSGKYRNLIEDSIKIFDLIIDMKKDFKPNRIEGVIQRIEQKNKYIIVLYNKQTYWLHINNFIEKQDISKLKIGDIIYFEPSSTDKGLKAINASVVDLDYNIIFNKIYTDKIKRNQFALFLITNDAKSFSGSGELDLFNQKYKEVVDAILEYQELDFMKKNSELKLCLNKVLACNYTYMPEKRLNNVMDLLNNNQYDIDFAYLVADMSEEWQKTIFNELLSFVEKKASMLKVYQFLGVCLWRCQDLIYQLSDKQIELILTGLVETIDKFLNKDKVKRGNFYALSKYWQLVLALLRLRNKESIKHLFNPSSSMIEHLLDLLMKTEQLILEQERLNNKQKFRTYVDFDIKKPEDEKSSDFFYALRLYLSGDDGANAIRIKVNEEN